jgi:carboxypeptidase C (cathepsin A)
VFTKPEGSWGDVADVIFLDQPAGTGWSWYDKEPVGRLEDAGIEVQQFLSQFIQMYPEYNKR